ncbi:MAG: undecaprenyldiphospho-muramoylpentapeptide beta-N-acetylglucosaminyltransferase [Pseudomonadota bacterium]|nr:undecaprenyldiphospho-muramoylpentapeptide beta-N-acetylglucosaminyltransferase [Pseudomonadota bacterium]
MPKIVFTGGGTAGHVVPNIALIEHLGQLGWESSYIGSYSGIEKQLITPLDVPYHGISSGKLRRQLTLRNLLTPFQVLHGIGQAWQLLRTIRPDVVFSKGGFVAFPVVFAAWLNRIPVILHEADLTPGLANRLSMPFAKQICINFPGGLKYYSNPAKVSVTGIPLRAGLVKGDPARGLAFLNFDKSKPVLLIFGGSLGSTKLNKVIHATITKLCEDFQVVHVCGTNNINNDFKSLTNYRQFEFVNENFGDIIACADLVISRAGANAVYELITLGKPHILIPLPTTASRGDQIENAAYTEQQGLSHVIKDEDLNVAMLLQAVQNCWQQREQIKLKLNTYQSHNSLELITELLMLSIP